MNVFLLIRMSTVHAWCSLKPKEGIKSPRTVVRHSCELSHEYWNRTWSYACKYSHHWPISPSPINLCEMFVLSTWFDHVLLPLCLPSYISLAIYSLWFFMYLISILFKTKSVTIIDHSPDHAQLWDKSYIEIQLTWNVCGLYRRNPIIKQKKRLFELLINFLWCVYFCFICLLHICLHVCLYEGVRSLEL